MSGFDLHSNKIMRKDVLNKDSFSPSRLGFKIFIRFLLQESKIKYNKQAIIKYRIPF